MSTANSIEHVAETNGEMKAESSGGGGDHGIELVEQQTNDGENNASSKKLNDIQIEIETRNENGAEDKIEIVIENSNPKPAVVEECETSANNSDNAEIAKMADGQGENSASVCQQSQNCDELKRTRTNSVHFGVR